MPMTLSSRFAPVSSDQRSILLLAPMISVDLPLTKLSVVSRRRKKILKESVLSEAPGLLWIDLRTVTETEVRDPFAATDVTLGRAAALSPMRMRRTDARRLPTAKRTIAKLVLLICCCRQAAGAVTAATVTNVVIVAKEIVTMIVRIVAAERDRSTMIAREEIGRMSGKSSTGVEVIRGAASMSCLMVTRDQARAGEDEQRVRRRALAVGGIQRFVGFLNFLMPVHGKRLSTSV